MAAGDGAPSPGAEASRATEVFFDETFKEVGVAEFFRRNLHMLGYGGRIKSLTTVVHEFVTNALDACEEAGIPPDVRVELRAKGEGHYLLVVRDNGPGIPASYVGKVYGKMLAGTKFHRYIQSRGQQGIGAVGAILFSQITTGKPFRVTTSTGDGVVHTFVMDLDLKANSARVHETVLERVEESPEEHRGVRIQAEYKDVQYSRGPNGVYEYLRRTGIVNPHARILLDEPDGTRVEFPRTSDLVPKRPKEVKPHPLGLTADDLLQLARGTAGSYRKLSSMLSNELSRVSPATARELQEAVAVDMGMAPEQLTHNQAEAIVAGFKRLKLMAPPTEGLIAIGEEHIDGSLRAMLKPEFTAVVVRRPCVYRGGIPFQVEAGLAFGGEAGHRVEGSERLEVMRFANRAPLMFDAGGCLLTAAAESVDWKRYGLRSVDEAPLTIFLNLISPHVPYTSAGKQAVAEEEDVQAEVRNALMEVGRKLSHFLSGRRREDELVTKRRTFERYIQEVADSLAELAGGDAAAYAASLGAVVDRKLQLIASGEDEGEEQEQEQEAAEVSPSDEGEAGD